MLRAVLIYLAVYVEEKRLVSQYMVDRVTAGIALKQMAKHSTFRLQAQLIIEKLHQPPGTASPGRNFIRAILS